MYTSLRGESAWVFLVGSYSYLGFVGELGMSEVHFSLLTWPATVFCGIVVVLLVEIPLRYDGSSIMM